MNWCLTHFIERLNVLLSCSPQRGSTETARARLWMTSLHKRHKTENAREKREATPLRVLTQNSKEYLVLKREDKERGESMSEARSVQEINAERNKMGNSYSPPQLCFLFAHKWFRPSVQAPRQPSYACATGAEKLVCATHLSETMSPFVECAMARGLASCFTVKFKNHGGFSWWLPCFFGTGEKFRFLLLRLLTLF